jgi:integrase
MPDGYKDDGKTRNRPTVRGKTRAEVKDKLDQLRDEINAGIRTPTTYTIEQCVRDWLDSIERDPHTMATLHSQAKKWIYPKIGSTKLKDFNATDADRFFRELGEVLSKRSLVMIKSTSLKAHKARQDRERLEAGEAWHANNLVFCHENGDAYTSDALNWRFSKMTRKAGVGHWHAHEGRHTAVSIMSSNGVPIQDISDTVGHKSTDVTPRLSSSVIVPAIHGGATVMDDVFGEDDTDADENNENAKSA